MAESEFLNGLSSNARQWGKKKKTYHIPIDSSVIGSVSDKVPPTGCHPFGAALDAGGRERPLGCVLRTRQRHDGNLIAQQPSNRWRWAKRMLQLYPNRTSNCPSRGSKRLPRSATACPTETLRSGQRNERARQNRPTEISAIGLTGRQPTVRERCLIYVGVSYQSSPCWDYYPTVLRSHCCPLLSPSFQSKSIDVFISLRLGALFFFFFLLDILGKGSFEELWDGRTASRVPRSPTWHREARQDQTPKGSETSDKAGLGPAIG